MSPVLEKYHVAFAYSDDRAGTLSMSATPALLADYMNGFNTMQKAWSLKYDADSLLKQNKQYSHLPAPADHSIIVTVDHPDVGLSRIDNESLTLDSFSLPLADLAEIAEAWRVFMTEYKYRKVEVAGGEGIIDIISDGFANALVIKTAVAVSWPDCAGSIGEYYSVSKHTTGEQMALAGSLNQVVNTGTDSEILAATAVFLNLFTDGVYHIAIGEIDVNTEGIGHDNMMIYNETVADADKFDYHGFDYNGEEPYLFSRSYHTINQNRVAEYVKLISAGARSKVVTYHHDYYYDSPTSPHYIIDGHHKLLAYMQLRVPAPAISITKDDESVKIVGNITPRITGAVKRVELKHILVNNENTGDVSIYMDEGLTPVIDEIFQEDGHIGSDLLTVLHTTWHSADARQHAWAEKRLDALAQNKNIGSKFGLYYKFKSPDLPQACWGQFLIANAGDFENWKDIFLNDKAPSPKMRARQDELRERFYPKPVPPQHPRAAELLKRFEQKQKQTQSKPDLPGNNIWYYVRIVLLIILIIRCLVSLMG